MGACIQSNNPKPIAIVLSLIFRFAAIANVWPVAGMVAVYLNAVSRAR
jgi:hypothetical protein